MTPSETCATIAGPRRRARQSVTSASSGIVSNAVCTLDSDREACDHGGTQESVLQTHSGTPIRRTGSSQKGEALSLYAANASACDSMEKTIPGDRRGFSWR